MAEKPTLIIMAAGMGSRYGGLKQIEPVDDGGHLIIDFSIFDAVRAGFGKVVFVIKPEMKDDVARIIGDRVSGYVEVAYAYQTLDALPAGFTVPEGRVKPWGTAHAVWSARHEVSGPFCSINSDDFYGPNAFREIYEFLNSGNIDNTYAMVGYHLGNTLPDSGWVSRGVCKATPDGKLCDIHEYVHVEKRGDGIIYIEDGKEYPLGNDDIVSMNIWGYGAEMMDEIESRFPAFLEKRLKTDPLKCEFYLPDVIKAAITEGKSTVEVLPCEDQWFGLTYREDRAMAARVLGELTAKGVYPRRLWD